MNVRLGWLSFCVVAASASVSFGGVLPLHVLSDQGSTFYEYFSDGFFRMDLVSPPPRQMNQSFHQISNPSVIYNQNFDGFPNDRQWRFGAVTYDESALPGGTGEAPITGLTFSMAAEPGNSTYLNWRRWTTNTLINPADVTGTVALAAGKPTGVSLTVPFQFEVIGALSATITGYYPGTLTFNGDQFTLTAEGMPVLDTVFGTGPFHLKWDFSGRLRTLAPGDGNFNRDDWVDGSDLLLWQATLGAAVGEPGSGADGDGSGAVDGPDLGVWQENFGFGVGANGRAATTAVPEPAALGLATLGAAAIGRRRRQDPAMTGRR